MKKEEIKKMTAEEKEAEINRRKDLFNRTAHEDYCDRTEKTHEELKENGYLSFETCSWYPDITDEEILEEDTDEDIKMWARLIVDEQIEKEEAEAEEDYDDECQRKVDLFNRTAHEEWFEYWDKKNKGFNAVERDWWIDWADKNHVEDYCDMPNSEIEKCAVKEVKNYIKKINA